MTIESMIETIYKYENVEITHTFLKDKTPLFTICLVKNSRTIQVTNLETENIMYYDSPEEATAVIQELIK